MDWIELVTRVGQNAWALMRFFGVIAVCYFFVRGVWSLGQTEKQLNSAKDLLERAAQHFADGIPPDKNWFRDYFLLTGEHMILTDEGWEPGAAKQSYEEQYAKDWPGEKFEPLDEVNAPK